MSKYVYECIAAECSYKTIGGNYDGISCPECGGHVTAVREARNGEFMVLGIPPLKKPIPLNAKPSIDEKLQYLDRLTGIIAAGVRDDLRNTTLASIKRVCDSIEQDLIMGTGDQYP